MKKKLTKEELKVLQKNKDAIKIKLFLGLTLLILALGFYGFNYFVTEYKQNQEQEVISDFENWKQGFNPQNQETYYKCATTKDTFRKLYCNVEFSKYYNQTLYFP